MFSETSNADLELNQQLHASVMKREAIKEKQYQEERAKREEEFLAQLGTGGTEMSKQELRKIVDSDRRIYYRTEELNDKLYIHYKGWKKIENLDGWTGLRALYAECNAFTVIEGLHNCRNLRSLFLQENCIRRISGLENCLQLWSLNLSNNFIERLENLRHLKSLNTLTITKNKIGLGGVDDILELQGTDITCVDIQDNLIWDVDVLPEVFVQMPGLRVLYLKGNPCAKQIPNYRKSVTAYCSDLRYLDDRPVFPEDRRAAEAFNRGGLEEERAERRRIREENSARHEANMKAFRLMCDEAQSRGREYKAMRAEDKYTEENDPVESVDRRMTRMVDKWKEENADELKDENLERAKRILEQEREQERKAGAQAAPPDTQPVDGGAVPGTVEAEPGAREEPAAEQETGLTKMVDEELAAEKAAKEKVDNRKLVYNDIWDDGPSIRALEPSEPSKPPTHVFAPPPRRGAASGGQHSSGSAAPHAQGIAANDVPGDTRPGAEHASASKPPSLQAAKDVPPQSKASAAAAAAAAAGGSRAPACSELQEMD